MQTQQTDYRNDWGGHRKFAKVAAAGLALGLVVAMLGFVASAARAGIPAAWQHRQNVCNTLSFYSVNPAYNPGATRTHLLGKYKRLYYTSGPIVKGWVPVYSVGQEHWHTGWVQQGQGCLVPGWPYQSAGSVIY